MAGLRMRNLMDWKFTGLIGLLVAAVKTKRVEREKGADVLNKLARSDFRISSDLLLWAKEETG